MQRGLKRKEHGTEVPDTKIRCHPDFRPTEYSLICKDMEYHVPKEVILASSLLTNALGGLEPGERSILLPDEYAREGILPKLLIAVRDKKYEARDPKEANQFLRLCERMAFVEAVEKFIMFIWDYFLNPTDETCMKDFKYVRFESEEDAIRDEDKKNDYIYRPPITDTRKALLLFLPTALEFRNPNLYQCCLPAIYSSSVFSFQKDEKLDTEIQSLLNQIPPKDLVDLTTALHHTFRSLPPYAANLDALVYVQEIILAIAMYGKEACRCKCCIRFKSKPIKEVQ